MAFIPLIQGIDTRGSPYGLHTVDSDSDLLVCAFPKVRVSTLPLFLLIFADNRTHVSRMPYNTNQDLILQQVYNRWHIATLP